MSKKENKKNEVLNILRDEAEKILAGTWEKNKESLIKTKELKELLHELEVYQVELEMQNDELRLSQELVEKERLRFSGFFNFAPVGFLILNKFAIILESNDTGLMMLDIARNKLIGMRFLNFVVSEDVEIFYIFIKKLIVAGTSQTCQLRMRSSKQDPYHILVEGKSVSDIISQDTHYYLAIIDVTGKKKLEEETLLLKEDQQKNILKTIIQTQEDERIRISTDLHDSVGQLLYAASLNLEKSKSTEPTIKNAMKLLGQAITEARNISFELAPSILTDFGLTIALKEMVKRVSVPGLRFNMKLIGLNARLELSSEIFIFRIIQELVNNVIKHANATEASIELNRKKEIIQLKVKDNGIGFYTRDKIPKASGFYSIKNRLALYKGTLKIESEKNKGTLIMIEIFDMK